MKHRLPKLRVMDLSALNLAADRTALRVFMMADNVEELEPTSRSFQELAWERAHESVRRRRLRPTGVWVLAFSALDVADWDRYLAPHLADQIRAQMRDLAGTELHWRVCALIDSADLKASES